jgi:transcriptional regulator with XRE-family HTH domain
MLAIPPVRGGDDVSIEIDFGRGIRMAMAKNDIPAKKMATELKVVPSTIVQWRKGRVVPTLPRLMEIAEICDVTMEQLIRYSESE